MFIDAVVLKGHPGCEITKNDWIFFRKATSKNWLSAALSGFLKTPGKHCILVSKFLVSKALIFTMFPFGNPCQKNGFPTVFLGVPESQ